MHELDSRFFEEYKRLERLCSDMYSCKNGVSEYIEQMESSVYAGKRHVPLWDSDYKLLKHVRWVRNQIAHDCASCQISEPSDLAFVENFHSRIISGQDPLTLLRKATDSEAERIKAVQHQLDTTQQKYRQQTYHRQTSSYSNSVEPKSGSSALAVFFILCIIAGIFAVILYACHLF